MEWIHCLICAVAIGFSVWAKWRGVDWYGGEGNVDVEFDYDWFDTDDFD